MALHISSPVFKLEHHRPTLPQSLLDTMLPSSSPEKFDPRNDPFARAFREARDAAGLTRRDIFEKMDYNRNINKAYRIIDNVLDGSNNDPICVQRVAKALGIPDQKMAELLAEQRTLVKEYHVDSIDRYQHEKYRQYGPYLYLMPVREWRPPTGMCFIGDGPLRIQVPHSVENDQLITLDYDAISEAIRNRPPWFKVWDRIKYGAYLYHRLPDEKAYFDLEGQLIRNSDGSLGYPGGVKELIF